MNLAPTLMMVPSSWPRSSLYCNIGQLFNIKWKRRQSSAMYHIHRHVRIAQPDQLTITKNRDYHKNSTPSRQMRDVKRFHFVCPTYNIIISYILKIHLRKYLFHTSPSSASSVFVNLFSCLWNIILQPHFFRF